MLFLILCIIANTLIALALRIGGEKSGNRMALFSANYAVCLILSLLYGSGASPSADGRSLSVALGLGTGILFLGTFVIFQKNIERNGVILSSTFMKLGIVIPTVTAVLLFGEKPNALQIGGILLAVVAILVMNLPGKKEEDKSAGKARWFLLVLLLVSGATDMMLNVHDELGRTEQTDLFLCCIFLSAILFAIILCIREKKPVTGKDILAGVFVGIPNYYASRFLVLSLTELPAVVVYPVMSVGTILLLSVSGMLLFRERLKKNEWIAMAIILAALVLLNR